MQGTNMTRSIARLLCGIAIIAAAPVAAQAQDQQQTPSVPSIAIGDTVQGQIAAPIAGCAENPRVRMWRFNGTAEQRIEITMQSEEFDTLVELGRLNGCEFQSLASNDDGNGPEDGLNSRLTVRLRETGSYVIRALAFADDGSGPFNLSIRQMPPAAAEPQPMTLTVGREARGQLTNRDATIPGGEEGISEGGGRAYHYYNLTGRAGDVMNLALDANEFDPVLEVGALSPLGYSVAQYNDDGGGPDDGLNSRLTVTFRSAGTVVLRVSTLGSGGTGSYQLRANRATGGQ
jgi:hypothetical protein